MLQRSSTFSFPRLSRGVTYYGILLVALFFSPRANASFILNFTEVGSDVAANGSGTINLLALTLAPTSSCVFNPVAWPSLGLAVAGSYISDACDLYNGFSGPSHFGSGAATAASTG